MTPRVCPAGCGRPTSGSGAFCHACWQRIPAGLRHAVTVSGRALDRQPLNGRLRDYHDQMVRSATVALLRRAARPDECDEDGEYAHYHGVDCDNPECRGASNGTARLRHCT